MTGASFTFRLRRRLAGSIEGLLRPRSVRQESAQFASAGTTLDTQRAFLREVRSEHPPDDSVDIVCVSKRPQQIEHVLACMDGQTLPNSRLRLMMTAEPESPERQRVERAIEGRSDVALSWVGPEWSIGAAMNEGIRLADATYVAKIDDDDHYGPNYLADLVQVANQLDVGVVGKHSYLAYLETRDVTVWRFPSQAYRFTPFLAGGSLLINPRRIRQARFPDRSLGEDQTFLVRCNERGVSTFASDPFNFVQVRHRSNTWDIPDENYEQGTQHMGDGLRLDLSYA